jgi:hypothetical protein
MRQRHDINGTARDNGNTTQGKLKLFDVQLTAVQVSRPGYWYWPGSTTVC